MGKKELIIIVILLISVLAFSYYYNSANKEKEVINSVCVKDDCFSVELATTHGERQRGLMFRDNLEQESGMLFIFDSVGNYPFWMKDTFISLDIIWIDEEKRIVQISENTPPCENDPCFSYDPSQDALYVLEINAGLSEELGIEIGDTVKFK